MNYGKIINDEFYFAPKKIENENNIIYNPSDDLLLLKGYLPLEYSNPLNSPPEGFEYTYIWQEQNNKIVQVWELVESPNEISSEEALSIITGGYV